MPRGKKELAEQIIPEQRVVEVEGDLRKTRDESIKGSFESALRPCR